MGTEAVKLVVGSMVVLQEKADESEAVGYRVPVDDSFSTSTDPVDYSSIASNSSNLIHPKALGIPFWEESHNTVSSDPMTSNSVSGLQRYNTPQPTEKAALPFFDNLESSPSAMIVTSPVKFSVTPAEAYDKNPEMLQPHLGMVSWSVDQKRNNEVNFEPVISVSNLIGPMLASEDEPVTTRWQNDYVLVVPSLTNFMLVQDDKGGTRKDSQGFSPTWGYPNVLTTSAWNSDVFQSEFSSFDHIRVNHSAATVLLLLNYTTLLRLPLVSMWQQLSNATKEITLSLLNLVALFSSAVVPTSAVQFMLEVAHLSVVLLQYNVQSSRDEAARGVIALIFCASIPIFVLCSDEDPAKEATNFIAHTIIEKHPRPAIDAKQPFAVWLWPQGIHCLIPFLQRNNPKSILHMLFIFCPGRCQVPSLYLAALCYFWRVSQFHKHVII